MRVLAVDTSSDIAAIAVTDGGVVLAELSLRVSAQHGETLLPHVARVLDEAKTERHAIDLLAVGLGPGSFTGVRIGVATMKGLALGLGRPLVGVRTSEVIARALLGRFRVVAIDAKKSEVFASVWEEGPRGELVARMPDVHGTPLEVGAAVRAVLAGAEAIAAGSGLRAHADLVPALGERVVIADGGFDAPRASVLARDAERVFGERGPDDVASLEPAYVRGADVTLPSR